MHNPKNILVTGGYGFIGSNLIQYIFGKVDFEGRIINFDNLTYAANPKNLEKVRKDHQGQRYFHINEDIANYKAVQHALETFKIDTIIHLAAESHVDRSITGPAKFVETNINGTFSLLEACRRTWQDRKDVRFHHVGTDEVYGSLPETGYFTEQTPYDPRSPYSASKASSDHLVFAYFHTYGLPITMSNCSNNYGPYQFPEKLIPLMIMNILEGKPLPIYGDGKNIRDWLYVEDHCEAIWMIVQHAMAGDKYNVGGNNEWENVHLVHKIIEFVAEQTRTNVDQYLPLITYVKDRLGHDRRYAIDCDKLKKELGWDQKVTFETGLAKTVEWYLTETAWLNDIRARFSQAKPTSYSNPVEARELIPV